MSSLRKWGALYEVYKVSHRASIVRSLYKKPRMQLDHLAEESHRSESELANEAVALYLAQQRRITVRIQEGLAQAQRGEFVTDEEIEILFVRLLS